MAGAAGVLFDVDGTLVDSNYLHVVAWRRAFDELGVSVPMSRLHHHVGMGADRFVEVVAGHHVEGARDAHTRHYDPFKEELRAFDSAAALLRAVRERGARVVLATSASEEEVEALLKALDADDAIDHVTGSADADESKPAPDIFRAALDRGGVDATRAMVVGDTVWDVEAARHCDLPCVCVLTGGIAEERLRAAGAVDVYDDVGALLAALDGSPLSRLWRG